MLVGTSFCQYCGTAVHSAKGSSKKGSMFCSKCGKFMPLRGGIDSKSMCPDCERQHLHMLAWQRQQQELGKSTQVNLIAERHPELRGMITQKIGAPVLGGTFYVDDHAFNEICNWDACVTQAKNFQLARRFEDSARLYESIGLWKEAGAVREKKSSRTVKHVTVNLNELIETLKRGGLAVPYKCGGCGATITVDSSSNADGLKFCSYCGSAINIEALAKVVQDALS